MAYSTEQIRAALAVLDIDAAEVLSQLTDRDDADYDTPSVEHAALVGLLYRKLATELREVVSGAETMPQFMHRYLAVSPQNITVSGEDHAAQADFDAHWLDDRVSAMEDSVEHDAKGRMLMPTLHGAIGQATEATKMLLEIHRDRRRGESPEVTAILYDTVTDRLHRCKSLTKAARQGVVAVPLSDDQPGR